ncbi:ribonuclease T2 family protein [Rodentibacter caecimuris]|uniref:Ribonuclease n=1 Tax=Rodentibacter caecimuris TaxID=1796644 RepID=A0ABX3KXQ4_9PAST|nr:ribonuclease [Rodentibacter heylii]
MKRQFSIISLVFILVVGAWQYFHPTDSHNILSSTVQNNIQSAVKNMDILDNYDVSMRDDSIGPNATAPVDYYMLVLSWSPAFCTEQKQKFGKNLPTSAQYQCGLRQFGWVVHGLWPQNANARSVTDHPRFCQGDLPSLPKDLITSYLNISPSAKLLQGEWEKHGACAFSSAKAYFDKQQTLFEQLVFPTHELKRKELLRWMKQHNSQLKNIYLKANHSELFICYDLNWQIRDCPQG